MFKNSKGARYWLSCFISKKTEKKPRSAKSVNQYTQSSHSLNPIHHLHDKILYNALNVLTEKINIQFSTLTYLLCIFRCTKICHSIECKSITHARSNLHTIPEGVFSPVNPSFVISVTTSSRSFVLTDRS